MKVVMLIVLIKINRIISLLYKLKSVSIKMELNAFIEFDPNSP